MARGETAADLRPLPKSDLARTLAFVAAGWSVGEICEATGWDEPQATRLVKEALGEEERGILSRSSEAIFVDYVVRTRSHIRELDDLFESLRTSNQGSAAVGAIKAKQDLLDRMIERGQELGFVAKRPERKTVLFAHLDERGLAEALATELGGLRDLMSRHGEAPLLEVEAIEVTRERIPDRTGPKPKSEFLGPLGRERETPRLTAPAPPPEPVVVRRKAIPLRSFPSLD